jgi:hypothetical protein
MVTSIADAKGKWQKPFSYVGLFLPAKGLPKMSKSAKV